MKLNEHQINIINDLVIFNQKLDDVLKKLEELKQDNQQLHETFGYTRNYADIGIESYKQTG